jgi:hypothetical protein
MKVNIFFICLFFYKLLYLLSQGSCRVTDLFMLEFNVAATSTMGSVFLSKAGQRRFKLAKVGTQRKFRSKSILGSKLIENWGELWTTSEGFVMNHGKTDLKPWRKWSYCEFDCNLMISQNEMNVPCRPHRPPRCLFCDSFKGILIFCVIFISQIIRYFNEPKRV